MATLTINKTFGSHWASAPAGFDACLTRVISDLVANLAPALTTTFTINFDYGFINGRSIGSGVGGTNDMPFTSSSFTYAQTKAALLALTANSLQSAAYATMPSSSPFPGGSTIKTSQILQSAIGLSGWTSNIAGIYIGISSEPTWDTTVDGSTSAGGLSLYGVLMHEITEVLGRTSSADAGAAGDYTTVDMFTYDNLGVRNFTATSGTYRGASADGGSTILGYFDQGGNSVLDPGDFSPGLNTFGLNSFFDSPNAAGFAASRSPTEPLRATDWQLMTLLGWGLTSTGLTNAGLTGGGSPPACSVNPTLSGTARTGNTLSVSSNGTWSNSPAFSYQWTKNGSTIGGATSNTYTPTNSDRDALFACVVTGTNGSGNASASTATSGVWLSNTKASPFLR